MAESTQGSKQTLRAPDAGQSIVVVAVPGQDIVLDSAFDQADPKVSDNTVVFEFAGGGQVVIDFSELGDAPAPNIVMADGTVLNVQEFLASLGEGDVEPAAGPEGGGTGSGGVGEYRDDAGNLIDGVDKLGGLDPRDFSSITVEGLEADNALPSAGIVDGAADEDGLRISEMTPFDGNDDERGGDHPAQFAYVEGVLSYDFGGDGPAGTDPFVWSLAGLAAKGVTSQGYTLLYEVVDGVTLNAYYMGVPEYPEYPEYPGEDDGPAIAALDQPELPPVKVLVFSLTVTDLDTGAFRFELYRPLDHSDSGSEDDIVYNFTFTLTDGSGDSVVGGLNMIVDDDSPIWKAGEANVSALVVEETMSYDDGDLSEGNGDSSGLGAQLASSSSGNQASIEAFLGITAGGLSPLAASGEGSDNATNGSAMKTTIMVEAGDEISFSWFFNADDYTPFNDFSFVSFNGQPFELADISMVGSYNETPWATYTFTAAADGPLTLGFGVMNTGDSGVNSYLQIDNIKVNGVSVPNGGFQNGDFSHWDTLGDPSLVVNTMVLATDEANGLSGSLAELASFGADGPGEFAMLTDTSELPTLFSKGEEVQYVVEGNTLIAYVGEHPSGSGEEEYSVSVIDDGGYRVVFTLQINPDGSWFFDLQDQLDHVDDGTDGKNFDLITGGDGESVSSVSAIDFSSLLKVTDGDGDELTAAPAGSFTIQIQDDVPVASGQKIVFTVDEDDIDTPWSQGTYPNDGNADGSLTGGPGDPGHVQPAYVAGSVAAAVSFGADEYGSFAFTDDIVEKMEALQLYSKQTALPENGLLLTYSLSYAGNWAILTAYEPDTKGWGDTGNPVFQLKLDQTNGDFQFRLYDELIHVAPESGADENFFLRSGEDGSIEAINFGAVIQAVDFDGDAVTLDGVFEIQVRDDIPVVDVDIKKYGEVIHDESVGLQNDDVYSGSVAGLFSSVDNPGDDPDVAGSGAIGYARSGSSIVSVDWSDTETGADAPALGGSYSLAILNATSGLQTTEGADITLSLDGAGRIIGTVASGVNAGKTAFAIAIDGGDGEVFIAQYLSIKHPDTGDHDKEVNLSGKIAVRYSLTDSDGDTVYDQIDVGKRVAFDDDGPSITVKASYEAESGLTLRTYDEKTKGANFDTDSRTFSSAFSSILTPGSDGLGNLTAMSYALTLFYGVKDSGLNSNGANVNLYKVGSAIFGSTANNSYNVNDANTVFKLEVESGGVVKLTQFQEIDHTAPGEGSGYSGQLAVLGNNLVKLTATQTITDGDGDKDTDSASIDLGGNILFADDGPSASKTTAETLDDEGLDAGIAGGLGDAPGEKIFVEGTLPHDFGADGAGSISFAAMNGQTGTVGVEQVTYSWNAGSNTLTATVTGGSGRIGTELFKVEVTDPATGKYEVTLLDNVLHVAGGKLAVNVGNLDGLEGVVLVKAMAQGDAAPEIINNGGAFGIASTVDGGNGGRFNEINYDLTSNPTGSEVMAFQLLGERIASSAVVDMTLFFGNETGVGNEVGSYELWLDGVKVQDAVSFQANSGSGNYQLAIAGPEGGFDEIRFAALPGTSPTGSDDSDYSIKQVEFDMSYENDANVALTYTVFDGDKDFANGTLHLVIDDDMPNTVQNIAGSPMPVDEFRAGGLQSGWVAPFDPNVDIKHDPDGDGDFQEIEWGTEGGMSGYEFVDNTDLQGAGSTLGLGTFTVGTFVHNNFPITSGTSISTAFLKVSFDITIDGNTETVEHTIKFSHNETPNPAPDVVTIIDGTEEVEVVVGGLKYVLELGFKSGSDLVTKITTAENASTSVDLMAELKLAPDYLDLEGEVDVQYGADGPGSLAWIGVTDDGTIEGEYGTLEVDGADYKYTLNEGAEVPKDAFETFHYSVTDADGDSATSSLTIMLEYKGEIG